MLLGRMKGASRATSGPGASSHVATRLGELGCPPQDGFGIAYLLREEQAQRLLDYAGLLRWPTGISAGAARLRPGNPGLPAFLFACMPPRPPSCRPAHPACLASSVLPALSLTFWEQAASWGCPSGAQ
jgi:hypothetical protein